MIEINKLIHDDCLNVMKDIPDKYFDLTLTDYPYGVNIDYNSYKDTQENLIELIKNTESEIKRISKFALITCGTLNINKFRLYDEIFCIYQPANASFTKYGQNTWQPILVYGDDVISSLRDRWTSIKLTELAPVNGHQCPKPLQFWKKVLLRGSKNENDLVFDPFAGSGTTAIACIDLNRNYICIEKDKDYFDKATERINKELIKIKMF